MSEIINLLVEMGFSKERAELALSRTNAKTIEEAMEWILSNEDTDPPLLDTASSATPLQENLDEKANSEATEKSEALEAKSMKCEDCGKLFQNQTELEFHAVKSGHQNFSESTEEKKPLSEDEKKEQLAKMESKLKQRRLERELREKEEELEREKSRIRSGKDLSEAKRKQEEAEIKKIIDLRKREKQEEKLARERVKKQIEQDKQARKALFGGETATSVVPQEQPSIATVIAPKTEQPHYQEVKLQIRLTNGKNLVHTFGAKEPLSAVRLYVEMHRTDDQGAFNLRTSYPNRLFNYEDYDKPLDILGLAPSSVLIVSKADPEYRN